MKKFLHEILMIVIPWKIWSWNQTRIFMRINYWSNKEEFDRKAGKNVQKNY